MAFERQTAIKININSLLTGKYITTQETEPNYLLVNGIKISRANIIGVIVSKESSDSSGSASLILDDGTARIVVRSFEENKALDLSSVGDIVLFIGKPREYNSEVFLVPEIISKIDDPKWIEIRKHELKTSPVVQNVKQEVQQQKMQQIETEQIVESEEKVEDIPSSTLVQEIEKEVSNVKKSPSDILISLIKNIDKGDGAGFEEVISQSSNEHAETIIESLLKNGEIFELRPGKLKVLE